VQIHFVPWVADRPETARRWQSRQVVVTPELLGMRSTAECQLRADELGFTPMPSLPRRQEYWRLDALLTWSRANGLDRLPCLSRAVPRQPFRSAAVFRDGAALHTRSPLRAMERTTESLR
jgi:hypothetical protein